MKTYFYLHTNGELIHKRLLPDPSDFVKKIWKIDTEERGDVWILAVEALALGARKERVFELKEKWGLTDEDAQAFAKRTGMKLLKDGDQWCAVFHDFKNLQLSQAGFGDTCLEALADYAKQGLNERRK